MNLRAPLQALAIVALTVAACAPAVDSQATQAAMDTMHMSETQTAMDAMHMSETETAMTTMHATETQTAMETMHAEETKTAMEASTTMMTMSAGAIMALQHTGTGTVAIVGSQADGYHLELKGFKVDSGPDLHVVLTSLAMVDKAVTTLPDAIDLGLLPATEGDLTLPIPADTDLSKSAAVVIWCETYSVPFVYAALTAP